MTERLGVTKGEPTNGIATELALYQLTVPVAQVADNEAVAPEQIVGLFVPDGAVRGLPTVTETATKGLKQAPLSQRTLYVVFAERLGVTKGEPTNGIATELALYQLTVPVAQVADNEAVAPEQIVGLFVPVGAVILPIVTETATKGLKQAPLSQRTL